MGRNIVLYVTGKYRSGSVCGIANNIQQARDIAIACWEQGYTVICPHLNTAFMDDVVSDEDFLLGDLEILSRCNGIVLGYEWENSVGSIAEVEKACALGLRIFKAHRSNDFPGWHIQELHRQQTNIVKLNLKEKAILYGLL